MTNGHVEGVSGAAGATVPDPKSTSDQGDMENTMEHKLMRAFAQRRQLKRTAEAPPALPSPAANAPPAPDVKGEPKRNEKKKKGWRRLPILRKLIRPKTKKPEPEEVPEPGPEEAPEPEPKLSLGGFPPEKASENEFEHVAKRLTDLVDEIQFVPSEFESDDDDDLEKLIALLLRTSGDEFNQKMIEQKVNPRVLFEYRFFEGLLTTFLERIGYRNARSDDLQPQASTETQVAVACEITSRLSAADTLPSSRMLNFGAAYLQQHYSHWVQQQSSREAEVHSDEEVE